MSLRRTAHDFIETATRWRPAAGSYYTARPVISAENNTTLVSPACMQREPEAAHRVELFGVVDEQLNVGRQLSQVVVLVRVEVHLDLGEVDRVLHRLPGSSARHDGTGGGGGTGLPATGVARFSSFSVLCNSISRAGAVDIPSQRRK